MIIAWTAAAFYDRDVIFDYIEAENPLAAVMVDDRIRDKVQPLCEFPNMGREGQVDGTRELVVTGLPYLVVYRVEPDAVRILRVLHTAQQWPDSVTQ